MRVRFIKFGSNSAFGSFAPGDLLVCGDAMARHLIDVAQVAVPAPAPPQGDDVGATVAPTPVRTKPKPRRAHP